MHTKPRLLLVAVAALAAVGILLAAAHLLPLNFLSVQQKPEQAPQKVYEYYLIIDEATGSTLMHVPLVVSPGDEVITEENKRYTVVRVEENRAFARYVEDVDLKKYQPK